MDSPNECDQQLPSVAANNAATAFQDARPLKNESHMASVAEEENNSAIPQIVGDNVMARIIEFHIPAAFRPKTKRVPQVQRGRLLVFPGNLRKSA